MTLEARFSTVGGKGVGRWRVYYRPLDMQEAKWAAKSLVPTCQVRLREGREIVAGPMRARDLAGYVS